MGYTKEQLTPELFAQIAKDNNLKNINLIYPGQKLELPVLGGKNPDTSQSKTSDADKSTETAKKKAPTTSNSQTVSQTRTKKPSTPTTERKKPVKTNPQPTKTAKTAKTKNEERNANSEFALRKVKNHLVSKGFALKHLWVYDDFQKGDGVMVITAKINNPADARNGKGWRFEVVNGKIQKEYAL